MRAKVTWVDGVQFQGESETGHTVVMDGPPAMGGRDLGARPMELLLLGVGGCSTFDVLTILQKSRQDVTDCQVDIQAERADAIPAVFTKIHMLFKVTGNQLKESQVKRAVKLSAEKYCSASIMLGSAGVEISHDYEIISG